MRSTWPLAVGDLRTVATVQSERAALHIPGTTDVSGSHQGRQAILRLWDKLVGPSTAACGSTPNGP